MLLDLPDEIIYKIFINLNNEDIFILNEICKEFNSLMKAEDFINYIWFRYHPITFNILGNFCHTCNLGIYKIKKKFKYIRCNHVY